MAYTVGEMARRLGVPASTIRYYDKEGLLPFVGRSSGGIRVFTEKDFEWLRIIECLKKTGMSLKDIREYIELAMQGDETIARRLELFRKQRTVLETRMAELQQTMDTLDYKCWFYETAAARGSTEGISDLPDEALPEALRPVRERLRSNRASKNGSTRLRKTLFQVMSTYLQNKPVNEPVYQFLDRKRAEGKPYLVYMTAGANKFLRIYYGKVKECLRNLEQSQIEES